MVTMSSFGGATNPGSFFEAYKFTNTKFFLPSEWLDQPDELQNREFA